MSSIYSFSFVLVIFIFIVLAYLIYIVYKKHKNKRFLLSIFVSTIFFMIIYIIFESCFDPFEFFVIGFYFMYYFYGSLIIIGFICGIVAGLFNEEMISATLSGVVGVFFGYLLNPLFYGILWVYLFAMDKISYFIFLSILFGGIGGLIGNQIKIWRN